MKPRAARDEMDELLDVAVTFAQEMLAQRGEFYPFAAIVLDEGQVAMSPADPHLGDRPDSLSVIAALTASLRAKAGSGEIRAAAICCDVRVDDDGSGMTDAIRTAIEHCEAPPVEVLLPYRRGSDGLVAYGDLRAGPAGPAVFVG